MNQVDRCPTCGQRLPKAGHLTPRELELLAAWWMSGTLRKAAEHIGVGEQRAKNMMSAARIRNQVATTDQLLAAHFATVREFVLRGMTHNSGREEAA